MTSTKTLKRLVLSIGCASLSLASLSGQTMGYLHYDQGNERSSLIQLQQDFVSTNYLGYLHDLPQLKLLPLQAEHLPLRTALASLVRKQASPEEVLTTFLKRYPGSLDRPTAELLLGLVYIDQGLLPLAQTQLQQVSPDLLSPREAAQRNLALGYTLLRNEKSSVDLEEARRLLLEASEDDSLIGEQALLYLGSVAWARGDYQEAQRIFSRPDYSETLAPEAAYQATLLSFVTEDPTTAQAKSLAFQRRYPELGKRASLRSALGQSYYIQGNYAKAIAMLQPLQELSDYHPTSAESYALGTALYATGRYEEALRPLSASAEDKTELGAQALFLLGNARLKLGRSSEAALAFSRAGEHPGATDRVKESALYNGILLQDQTQGANFGQTVRLAETFLTRFPRSAHRTQILQLLQSIFLTNKDYAESLATLERLNIKSPELTEAKQYVLLRLGEGALGRGDHGGAQEYLTRSLATGSHRDYTAQAHLLRATLALKLGDYATAEREASRSLASGHILPQAYYFQGYGRYNQKKYPEAYSSFDTFTKQAPATESLRRADAWMRMGDCQLIAKKSSEALSLYRRADESLPSGSDEALYRIASIYGRWGQYSKQVETLDRLRSAHPESTYLPDALYDKGRALVLGKSQASAAPAVFDELASKYPHSPQARLGAMEKAMLAYNSGRTEEAIQAYKSLIARYPESDEARAALSDLRSLYIAQDRVEEYTAYASTLGKQLSPNEGEKAHLQYLALESRYKKSPEATLPELEAFVSTYPSSREAGRAELLLARQYAKSGDRERALPLYRKLAAPARALDLRIPALEALSEIYTETDQKKEALDTWSQLYAIEGLEAPQHERYGVALAKASFEAKDYKRTLSVSEQLLKRTDLPSATRSELILLQGKGEEATGATGKAIKTYEPLLKEWDTATGAEAYIRHASLLFRAGKVQEAKRATDAFIAKGTPQQYWLARAFLLLADCYHKLGETYVAEQYVTSLRENYKGTEADIAQMINDRLNTYQKKK